MFAWWILDFNFQPQLSHARFSFIKSCSIIVYYGFTKSHTCSSTHHIQELGWTNQATGFKWKECDERRLNQSNLGFLHPCIVFGGIKNSISNSFKEVRRKSHCKCQGTDLCCQQLCLCEPATCHVGDVWSHPCTLMLPLRIHYSSCCTQTCSSHVLQRLRNFFWCTARRKVTRVLNVTTSGVLQIAVNSNI
jgi:hypothetical protein